MSIQAVPAKVTFVALIYAIVEVVPTALVKMRPVVVTFVELIYEMVLA